MRATHARMHRKGVVQGERSAGLNDRRTDGRIGWSTALRHFDLRHAEQLDRLRPRVDEFETAIRLDVEGTLPRSTVAAFGTSTPDELAPVVLVGVPAGMFEHARLRRCSRALSSWLVFVPAQSFHLDFLRRDERVPDPGG